MHCVTVECATALFGLDYIKWSGPTPSFRSEIFQNEPGLARAEVPETTFLRDSQSFQWVEAGPRLSHFLFLMPQGNCSTVEVLVQSSLPSLQLLQRGQLGLQL